MAVRFVWALCVRFGYNSLNSCWFEKVVVLRGIRTLVLSLSQAHVNVGGIW